MSRGKKLQIRSDGEAGDPSTHGGGCDHGTIELREGSADIEWFVARGELEMGRDLGHGAGHLANLLSFDPGNPEWLALLEQYIARAQPDPERLIPRKTPAYYATEAMRAYVWQRQGRLAEACQLLAQVTHAKQDSGYLEAWALPWREQPGALQAIPANEGWFLFALVLQRFPEARFSAARHLREIQRWARLCDDFARLHPGGSECRMMRAGILRKAGNFA